MFLRNATRILVFLLSYAQLSTYAQAPGQVIKGIVMDQTSESPLPGATLLLQTQEGLLGAISDVNGEFRLEGIPVGRYNLEVRFIGYESRIIPELLVASNRPVVLEIRLQEAVAQIDDLVVRAQIRKDIPINRMALLSARTFNVEETQRFAGGFDDPGRMAASFAGVAGGSPNDNALSIRGNAPKSLLWRVEGVTVPNPNHFAGMLVEGGGVVSLISGQLLNNSDFFHGAFPSEYGNALSGVFDMKLRTGDTEKRRWGFQAGTLGLDAFGEGPFVKGKKASYLFNYRYSTTSLFKDLIPEGQAPIFQDLSMKLNFPTEKAGTFSLWMIGGLDETSSDPVEDPAGWTSFDDRVKFHWKGKTGMAGLKHRYIFGGSNALITSLTATTSQFQEENDLLQTDGSFLEYSQVKNHSSMLSLQSVLTQKYNQKLSSRAGVTLSRISYDIALRRAAVPDSISLNLGSDAGHTQGIQTFYHLKYDMNESLSFSGGLHSMLFLLNNSVTLEPRLGISYSYLNGNTLGIAYGNHSQIDPLPAYFYQVEISPGNYLYPNKELRPSRSHHFVASYNRLITKNIRLSAELYQQNLYNIPVEPGSYYSMIHFKKEYLTQGPLVNEGTGINRGFDLTLEKFMSNGYYFMLTGSWIDSKYRGGDQKLYNNRYDYGYVFNSLAGKEFFLGSNNNKILGINGRFVMQGGERIHPIDLAQSQDLQQVVYDYSRAWAERLPRSMFVDFSASLRVNKANYSTVWGIQIKNLLLENSVFHHVYNHQSGKVDLKGEGFIFPNLSFRIEF